MEHVVYILDGAPFGMSPSIFSGDHLFLAGIGEFHTKHLLVVSWLRAFRRVCNVEDPTISVKKTHNTYIEVAPKSNNRTYIHSTY